MSKKFFTVVMLFFFTKSIFGFEVSSLDKLKIIFLKSNLFEDHVLTCEVGYVSGELEINSSLRNQDINKFIGDEKSLKEFVKPIRDKLELALIYYNKAAKSKGYDIKNNLREFSRHSCYYAAMIDKIII